MARDLHATIDAVWRIEAAKIIGALARMVRDVGLAEELAQDALVAALEHWPCDGIPDKPAAWLMATAKNRALDRLRQEALHLRKQEELGADADARGDHVVPDFSDALDDRDRMVMELQLQGVDGDEMAAALGTSVATGYQQVHRMKERLERCVGAVLVGEDPASQVSMLLKNQESFRLQEDKGTKPNVHYIGKYSPRA